MRGVEVDADQLDDVFEDGVESEEEDEEIADWIEEELEQEATSEEMREAYATATSTMPTFSVLDYEARKSTGGMCPKLGALISRHLREEQAKREKEAEEAAAKYAGQPLWTFDEKKAADVWEKIMSDC